MGRFVSFQIFELCKILVLFLSMRFSEFCMFRLMNMHAKCKHTNVLWNVCTQFLYREDVVGNFSHSYAFKYKGNCTDPKINLSSMYSKLMFFFTDFTVLTGSDCTCSGDKKSSPKRLSTATDFLSCRY